MATAAGARRRTPSRGDRREQAILEGARRLFGARPLSLVTVDDLAQAAGLSRSSFYFYFEGKSAVVGALLDGLSDELAAENSPWFESTGPSEPELRRACVHTVQVWRDHGALLRTAWQADPGDTQLSAWRAALLDRAVRRTVVKLERDREAGLAPVAPSADVLARALHSSRVALLSERAGSGDDASLTDDLVAITLRLLYGT